MNNQHDAYLSSLYYTAKSPASYSGPYKMWIHIKNKKDLPEGLSYKKVKEWYQSQVTHNIHIIPRKKFTREPIIVDHINEQMDCDLIDAARLKKYNSGFGYILVCIDLFSRYVWALSVKTKSGSDVAEAMRKILADGAAPSAIRSDRGREFVSKHFKTLLKDNGIHHILAYGQHKASYAERANRTLQERLYKYMYEHQTLRYIDILPEIVESYNSTIHSTIGIAPKDVNESNSYDIYEKVYMPLVIKQAKPVKFKFAVDDTVRISYQRMPFTRGYDQHFSEEIYKIQFRIPSNPPRYRLKDLNEEEIKGSFYEPELQKVDINPDTKFKIAKVHKNRKKKIDGKLHVLVSWLGYPKSADSFVPLSEIKLYKGK